MRKWPTSIMWNLFHFFFQGVGGGGFCQEDIEPRDFLFPSPHHVNLLFSRAKSLTNQSPLPGSYSSKSHKLSPFSNLDLCLLSSSLLLCWLLSQEPSQLNLIKISLLAPLMNSNAIESVVSYYGYRKKRTAW